MWDWEEDSVHQIFACMEGLPDCVLGERGRIVPGDLPLPFSQLTGAGRLVGVWDKDRRLKRIRNIMIMMSSHPLASSFSPFYRCEN